MISKPKKYAAFALATLLAFLLAFVPTAFSCDDPQLRSAVIGGHVIDAGVLRANRSQRRVKVQLLSLPAHKVIRTTITDGKGRFTIDDIPSGKYELSVGGWGSVEVELRAELDVSGTGQHPFCSLMLMDHGCIATTIIEN